MQEFANNYLNNVITHRAIKKTDLSAQACLFNWRKRVEFLVHWSHAFSLLLSSVLNNEISLILRETVKKGELYKRTCYRLLNEKCMTQPWQQSYRMRLLPRVLLNTNEISRPCSRTVNNTLSNN